MHLLAALAVAALPSVLTMDDALRLFRDRGFDLLVADAQVAAAQGDAASAGAIANPQISGSLGRSFGYDSTACAVQYEKGAASLLELLDAQRVWAQTRAEYLKDLRDFWLAVFQLDAAVGRT